MIGSLVRGLVRERGKEMAVHVVRVAIFTGCPIMWHSILNP
jgi:hypothetical protein